MKIDDPSFVRHSFSALQERLEVVPIVGLVGPRQVGKTTLAKAVAAQHPGAVYLDLERPSVTQRLADGEYFLQTLQDQLVVLDEIQRVPELFPLLRSLVDEQRRPGRFLILGSAAPELLRQSSETLAGRISYVTLHPFNVSEAQIRFAALPEFLLRGGYPLSLLAKSNAASFTWRRDFIQTFVERDLRTFGVDFPPANVHRFWRMLAHVHGQIWNASRFATGFGMSVSSVQRYLSVLESCYMVNVLPAFHSNLGKRLIKAPKVYIADTGLLMALLGIETALDLQVHDIAGHAWEGWVVQQLRVLAPQATLTYYRTSAGAEMDVVLEQGSTRWAFEIKFSANPALTKGFTQAQQDLQPQHTYVVAPVAQGYPLRAGVSVVGGHELPALLESLFVRSSKTSSSR